MEPEQIEIEKNEMMEFEGIAPETREAYFLRLGGRGYRWHRVAGYRVYVYATQDGGYDSIVNVASRCGKYKRVDIDDAMAPILFDASGEDHPICELCLQLPEGGK
jgi:hypothetical protein